MSHRQAEAWPTPLFHLCSSAIWEDIFHDKMKENNVKVHVIGKTQLWFYSNWRSLVTQWKHPAITHTSLHIANKTCRSEVQRWKKKRKEKELELNSLGSSEALTQFLHQRFSLPLFGDIREQLSVKSIRKTTCKHNSLSNKKEKMITLSLKISSHKESCSECTILLCIKMPPGRKEDRQRERERETRETPPSNFQLTSWWCWSPLRSYLSRDLTVGWWCLGAGCRSHCPDTKRHNVKDSPIIQSP